MAQAFEEECKRLRAMLQELIASKHVGNPSEYVELEEQMLQQKTLINELKARNQELDSEVNVRTREEKQLKERLRDYEKTEGKSGKLRDKLKKQKAAIDEGNERIAALTTENEEIRRELAELEEKTSKQVIDNSQNAVVEQLKGELEKLKKEREELKKRNEIAERKAQEKEREARDEKSRAKEKEDEYELKIFEEREKLSQRLVRRTNRSEHNVSIVERELSSKNKEIEATGKKARESETILKSLNEVRDVIKNVVQEDELAYSKSASLLQAGNEDLPHPHRQRLRCAEAGAVRRLPK